MRVVLHRLVDADGHLAREEGVDVVVVEGHVNGAVGDALDLLHGFIEGADDRLVVVAVLDLLLRREADVLNDVLHADKEVAVLVERRLARAVVEVVGQTVGILRELAHPVRNELVVLREEEADTLGKGDVDLAGVLFDVGLGGEVRDVEGLEVFFVGFGGELEVRDGLDILFELAVRRVAARKPRPRHIVGDVEVRRVAAPAVPVAAHEGIDEEAVRRPGKVLGVFIDGLEDEGHLVVLIFVGDGLVAVGVGLGVGDGDAVGGGMELAPALHVRPHAADEVGRGAVADGVVLRFARQLRHGVGVNVDEGRGEGHGLRRALPREGGEPVRRGEVVFREEGVHERVDAREVVFRALLGEGLRLAQRERLELMVGREHLGELVRFEEARRRFAAQRVERLGEMRHGDTSREEIVVSEGIIA